MSLCLLMEARTLAGGLTVSFARGLDQSTSGPQNVAAVVPGAGTTTLVIDSPAAYADVYQLESAGVAAGPLSLKPPALSGSVDAGGLLTVTPGFWAFEAGLDAPEFARQWKRDGVDIPGAMGLSYAITGADAGARITCEETATDENGARSALSPPSIALADPGDETVVVTAEAEDMTVDIGLPARFAQVTSIDVAALEAGPVSLSPPGISGGASVGAVLSAVPGLWAYDTAGGSPAVTYQWLRDGTAIGGASGATYTIVPADDAAVITLRETATDTAGSRDSTSDDARLIGGG